MGSYTVKGPMDDLLSQMNETDSQLSLIQKQIKRHEEYGDMWNDDENLNYFHMLEQQDELKKKKKKQEEEYQAAVETAKQESARAKERLNNPDNLTDDEISANQALLQNLSQGASIAKYQDMLNSGVKPKEIDRVWDAINSTNTLSNPYISDDDLMANQARVDALNGSDKKMEELRNAGKKTVGVPTYETTRTSDALTALNQGKNPYISDDDLMANLTRLDALRWQAEHPGVKQNEVDRVYDAIKNTDTQKNPYISDDDLMANQARLGALGGSWGEEDERKKKQKYFGLEDIPNRQYTDINKIITGDMFEKYLKQLGKTYGELRTDIGMRYGELLKGLSARERADAVTQIVAQEALDWGSGANMEDGGNKGVENQSGAGYNGGRQSPMVVLYDPAEKEEKIKKLSEKYKNGNIWDKALAILQMPGVTLEDRLKAARATYIRGMVANGANAQMASMAFDMTLSSALGSVTEAGVKGILGLKAAKNAANAVKAAEGVMGSADEAAETVASAQKAAGALTEGAGDYSTLAEKARNVDVSSSAHQAVFYSGEGNRAQAEGFAQLNGKTTLEMTPGGKYFESLKLFDPGSPVTEDQALEIWKILSERYAKSASGNVYGFVKGSRPGSIFNTVEYQALQKNPYITNIFTELFK